MSIAAIIPEALPQFNVWENDGIDKAGWGVRADAIIPGPHAGARASNTMAGSRRIKKSDGDLPPVPPVKYGPKSSYREKQHCAIARKLGGRGASETEMALACGMSRTQFREWQRKYPALKAAVQEALTAAEVHWEKRWAARMDGVGHNANAYKHMMASRFRDSYGERVQIAGDEEAPLTMIRRVIVDPKEKKKK